MVVRKQNLLDAFRHAAPEGRKAPFAPASIPAPGPADLKPVPEVEAAPRGPDPGTAPTWSSRMLADPRVRLTLLVAVLVGVGAYFAGRFGSKPAQAAGAQSETGGEAGGKGVLGAGTAAGADAAEKNQAAARMGTAFDRAFMDTANRFTVRLAQYQNDEAGLKLAQETAEFLRKQAIPAVAPIAKGKWVILAAGATPRREDLDSLLKLAQAQPGPPPFENKRPFASAYIDNIDAVVQRH